MSGPTIDGDLCASRLRAMRASWTANAEPMWANATACLLGTGSNKEDDLRYLKSASMQIWLFQYELPDTLMLFTKDELHVVTGGKKATLVSSVAEKVLADANVTVVVHVKPKGEDGKTQVDEVVDLIAERGLIVGAVAKEAEEGALVTHAHARLKEKGVKIVEVAAGLADAMSVRDATEATTMKKAASLAAKAMRWCVDTIEGVVNDETKISHAKLSEQCEDFILEPSKLGMKDVEAEDVDICYPPILQSGGEYELKLSAQSSDKKLHYGVVTISLGARVMQYCANVARTLMIDPTKAMEDVYAAALAAQEAALKALVDGADLAAPHDAAKAALIAANPNGMGEQLAAKLGKTIGTAIGLELRESSMTLGPKSRGAPQKIKAGQCYNVQIALNGLANADAKEGSKSATYAILIADTAAVAKDGAAADVMTKATTKALKDIAYQINDSAEEEEEEAAAANKKQAKAARVEEGGVVMDAKTRGEEGGPTDEDARRRKQAALADKKNQETYARLVGAKNAMASGGKGGATADFVAYESMADVPVPRGADPVLAVDRDNETVLLPIHGGLVPFHIMAVKSVSVTQDGGRSFVRINFNAPTAPGAIAANSTYPANMKFPDLTFLREISYRSSDTKHANYIVQEMRALKRTVSQRETEKAERATLVRQERLVLSHGRVHRLVGLWMLPTFGGRGGRKAGTLEAHTNGLRYVGAKADEQVDIIYSNVKFAFFQPAKKEIKTLIHFHLHNPIMIGKKKTHDVQFYMEIMEAVQSLDGGRRNMYDPDEIEEEQRDREREKRIHKEFSGFCRKVQDIWEKDFPQLNLEFDSPYHDLAFDGVPFKSTVRILPTATCLVELTEFPPLVVSSSDIEVVNLERVGFHLKNFDMAIVFKDFTKDVHRIDQIPVQNLDNIKQWLGTLDIKYYEGKANLNWKPLLKQIKEDPDDWLQAGGWEFLNNEVEDDDEDGEGGEESESDFAPSESEEESEEESESESVEESDDDDEEYDEDSEDEGMDWDELEEEAMAADEEASDGDDDRKRKKGGGGGGGKKQRR